MNTIKIKLVRTRSGAGELQIAKKDYALGHQLIRKISDFMYTHKHHVLRDHFNECKISNITLLGDQVNDDGTVLLLKFFAPYDDYKPYLDILQKEFDLQIEED